MHTHKWIKQVLCISVTGLLAMCPENLIAAESKEVFSVPLGQRQLFLDDVGIASMENLERVMHQPSKKGSVIRPCGYESVLQTRSAPMWDPEAKIFKLWMITSTSIPDSSGMTYVESKDGLHWTKPVVRQVEVNGSLENNFVSVDPKLKWPANAIENVVYDPDDPDPTRRYKGLAHCHGREPIVSPDGIHWRRLDVPSINSSDESNMSYDEQTKTFIATVKQGDKYGRSVYLTTSKDFEHWTKPELIFHSDELDQKLGRENIKARFANPLLQHARYNDSNAYNVDVYNMGVFRYEGLYIGIPAIYHSTGKCVNYPNTVGFGMLQLACSRDMKTWKRLGNRKPFIETSLLNSGAYDLTQILPPSRPILRTGMDSFSGKDELWFYYTGLKYRDSFDYVGTYPDGQMVMRTDLDADAGAICLAVLRRDGFISIDAGHKQGVLVTRAFTVTGCGLCVNVDALKGTLKVKILDDSGNVAAESEPVTGDELHARLQWKKGNLENLKGRKISLSFIIRDARLYSYWFE